MFVRPAFRKPFYGITATNYKPSPPSFILSKYFCTSQTASKLSGRSIHQQRNYTSLVWLGISAGVATIFSFYYYRAEPDRVNILLENSVYALVKAGNISRAIEVAMQLGNVYRKSNALKSICDKLIKNGDLNQAKQLLHLFPRFDRSCLQAYYESMILMEISRKFLEIGEEEMALEALEEAKEASNNMLAAHSVFFIKNFLEMGSFDKAKQVTNSIIHNEQSKKNIKVKNEALEAIAMAFLDARETNEAMRVMHLVSKSRELFENESKVH